MAPQPRRCGRREAINKPRLGRLGRHLRLLVAGRWRGACACQAARGHRCDSPGAREAAVPKGGGCAACCFSPRAHGTLRRPARGPPRRAGQAARAVCLQAPLFLQVADVLPGSPDRPCGAPLRVLLLANLGNVACWERLSVQRGRESHGTPRPPAAPGLPPLCGSGVGSGRPGGRGRGRRGGTPPRPSVPDALGAGPVYATRLSLTSDCAELSGRAAFRVAWQRRFRADACVFRSMYSRSLSLKVSPRKL